MNEHNDSERPEGLDPSQMPDAQFGIDDQPETQEDLTLTDEEIFMRTQPISTISENASILENGAEPIAEIWQQVEAKLGSSEETRSRLEALRELVETWARAAIVVARLSEANYTMTEEDITQEQAEWVDRGRKLFNRLNKNLKGTSTSTESEIRQISSQYDLDLGDILDNIIMDE